MKNQENPLISVIMPAYNDEEYIEEAIESILNQSYPNMEFIIVDDHSKDNTWKIIQTYSKKHDIIKPIRNEENIGIPKTRNKGFRKAKGKYYAIMDSDDISLKNRLKKQVKFLENNQEHGAIGSHTIIINEDTREIGIRKYPTSYQEIKKKITRINPIAQPSVMIRGKVIENNVGYYNEEYERCQDYDLWLRIADEFKICNLDEALIKYRVIDEKKGLNIRNSLKYDIKIQKNWLFHQKFFNPINIVFWVIEHLLILVPSRILLWILKDTQYDDITGTN